MFLCGKYVTYGCDSKPFRWKLKFVAYARYCAELPASRALIEQFSKDNAHVRQKLNVNGYYLNLQLMDCYRNVASKRIGISFDYKIC